VLYWKGKRRKGLHQNRAEEGKKGEKRGKETSLIYTCLILWHLALQKREKEKEVTIVSDSFPGKRRGDHISPTLLIEICKEKGREKREIGIGDAFMKSALLERGRKRKGESKRSDAQTGGEGRKARCRATIRPEERGKRPYSSEEKKKRGGGEVPSIFKNQTNFRRILPPVVGEGGVLLKGSFSSLFLRRYGP